MLAYLGLAGRLGGLKMVGLSVLLIVQKGYFLGNINRPTAPVECNFLFFCTEFVWAYQVDTQSAPSAHSVIFRPCCIPSASLKAPGASNLCCTNAMFCMPPMHSPHIVTTDEVKAKRPRTAKRMRKSGIEQRVQATNDVFFAMRKTKPSAAYHNGCLNDVISLLKQGHMAKGS